MEQIQQIREELLAELKTLENPSDILKSPKIKELYKIIPTLPNEQKGEFGSKVNDLKNETQAEVSKILEEKENSEIEEIDTLFNNRFILLPKRLPHLLVINSIDSLVR